MPNINTSSPPITSVKELKLFGMDENEEVGWIFSNSLVPVADYAAGIEITQYNQLVRDENGEFWRVSGQVDLPYVTTGAGIPEDDALVPVGDAVLRQDLANPGMGAAMVAGAVRYVQTIDDLAQIQSDSLKDGQPAQVVSTGRAGLFRWQSGDLSAECAADLLRGIYVPADGDDGSNGAWVRVLSDGVVTPEMFGAEGDGVADDSAAIAAALNSGNQVETGPVTYRIPAPIAVNRMVLTAANTKFDCTEIGGDVVFGFAVQGTEPEIEYMLSADAEAGAPIISIVSSENFEVGEWLAIYDPTDASWSPSRSVYRKGEFCRVQSVATGEVTVAGVLFDSYDAVTARVVRISNPGVLRITGALSIRFNDGEDSPLIGFRADLIQNVEIDGLSVEGGHSATSIKRCFGGSLHRVVSRVYAATAKSNYGIIFGNCQDIKIYGGRFHSDASHASDIGGGDTLAGIVNRNIVFRDCTLTGGGQQLSASIHGNSEFCGYDGGFANGGIIAGDNNFIRNMTVMFRQVGGSSAIRGTELLGTNHDISGNRFVYYDDAAASPSLSLFDFGMSGIINEDTTRGGTLRVEGNTVEYHGDRAEVVAFSFGNIGAAPDVAAQIHARVCGNTIKAPSGTTVIPLRSYGGPGVTDKLGSLRFARNDFHCDTGDLVTNFFTEVNYGEGFIERFVVPSLTYVTKNRGSLAANGSDRVYEREGRTEILGGTLFAADIAVSVVVDGRTVLSTLAAGAIGRARGTDEAGDLISALPLPHICAFNSIAIDVHEQAGIAQSYGAMIYVKEYS